MRRLPASTSVLRMIAQVRSASFSFEAHGRRIRIARTDAKVRRAVVGPMNVSLLPPFLGDPVISGGILRRQFFTLYRLRGRRGEAQALGRTLPLARGRKALRPRCLL